MTITTIALISFLACIAFTVWGAMQKQQHPGQTVLDSIVEAWTNIVIGFSINFCANLVILPQVVDGLTAWEAFLIGWPFTTIALFRQFIIRRHHNRKMIKKWQTS